MVDRKQIESLLDGLWHKSSCDHIDIAFGLAAIGLGMSEIAKNMNAMANLAVEVAKLTAAINAFTSAKAFLDATRQDDTNLTAGVYRCGHGNPCEFKEIIEEGSPCYYAHRCACQVI